MPKRKKGFDDPPIYTGFTMACPKVTNGKNIRAINACVRCKEDFLDKKHGYPSYCSRCGWDKTEQERRLAKMVGPQNARKLMALSEELSVITRKKINDGEYPYVF